MMGNDGRQPMFIFSPPMMGGMNNAPYVPEVIVPARVNKALEFLGMCAFKQMTRAAATDHNIELIEGQKLTEEEGAAYATACNLLTKYFAGELPLDEFEKLKVTGAKKAMNRKGDRNGVITQCPACPRPGNLSCNLCAGRGHVIISALADNEEVE